MIVLKKAFSRFAADDGLFLGAGISFYVITCILPLLLIFFAILGNFFYSTEEASIKVLAYVEKAMPFYIKDVSIVLSDLMKDRNVIGVLGFFALIIFSTQLFNSLRMVLNTVFRVEKSKGAIFGFFYDIMIMIVIGLFFLSTIVITSLLNLAEDYSLYLFNLKQSDLGIWDDIIGFAVSLLFTICMFFIIYRCVPNEKVNPINILYGSVLASILWEIAKQLFSLYVSNFQVYSKLYGSYGILIALIVWIYYSSLVFIYGAELIIVYEDNKRALQQTNLSDST